MREALERTSCPKCGHQQDGGAECQRCGVIFAKIRPTGETPASGPQAATEDATTAARPPTYRAPTISTPTKRTSNIGWLLLLLVAVLFAAYLDNHRRSAAPEAAARLVHDLGTPAYAVQRAPAQAPLGVRPIPPEPSTVPSPSTSPPTGAPTAGGSTERSSPSPP